MSDVSPSGFGATRIEIDDLSAHHRKGQLLGPELEVGRAEAYPQDVVPRPEEPGR